MFVLCLRKLRGKILSSPLVLCRRQCNDTDRSSNVNCEIQIDGLVNVPMSRVYYLVNSFSNDFGYWSLYDVTLFKWLIEFISFFRTRLSRTEVLIYLSSRTNFFSSSRRIDCVKLHKFRELS